MKIVFISGPLTSGWDGLGSRAEYIRHNVERAEKYQIALINAGLGCFCAHTHTRDHHLKGSRQPEQFYYELDFEFLKRSSDAVLAMPDWEKSSGATKEVVWAKEHNLPVFYPQSPADLDQIIAWAIKSS